jgi:hypothetical protein
MPQYMLLLRDSGSFPPDMSPEEMQGIIQRYVSWRNKVASGGRKITGHKLKDREGRLLRGKVGAPVTKDGPFAEANEVIGGLYVVDARDYSEAQRLASDCPHLDFGTIEIREIEPVG